jgi:putative hemolysin
MLTVAESSVLLLPNRPTVPQLPSKRDIRLETGDFVARLALTEEERMAAFRLRFLVFNLEMNEGLDSAYADGFDRDHFDDVCDHLIVEDRRTGAVVGTYRMQMGNVAVQYFGYYSEQEFSFAPYEAMRRQIVELGRACIHREYRSSDVLHLLWRGIARYALVNGARYMMGCCSVTSQDAEMGHGVYETLKNCMVVPELRTVATRAYELPAAAGALPDVQAPKLLRAYLTIGAKICSGPAIDRGFKTIDFLTLLDLQTLHPRVAKRFLEGC